MIAPASPEAIPVSVIVINKDGNELLQTCLAALYRQTYPSFEVVVVDNGSTDGSPENVQLRYPQANLIRLKENRGFAAANNIGIGQAKGEYIALLNNDTEAEPTWLKELATALETGPEFDFCASKMLLWGRRDHADACGDFATVEGMAGKIGHLEPASNHADPIEVFGACAGAAIYRRSLFEDVGLFDEDFFLVHEDSDLNFRARLMGHRCLFVPSAIVFHHVSATIGALSDLSVYLGSRNIEYVYVKNMPSSLVLKYGGLHLLANTLLFLLYLTRGKGWAFLKGKFAVVAALPRMLSKRRQIQASRRMISGELEGLLVRGWLPRAVKRWAQRRGRLTSA